MAVKTYGIHDKWLDINKLNSVDVKSVDGVIESVKINGEEAGGGGGVLSRATATFSSTTFQTDLRAVTIDENDLMEIRGLPFGGMVGDKIYNILLYKGLQKVLIPEGKTATVTGNATVDQLHINITGDCTITIE